MRHTDDLTLDEALSDPVIRAMMRADRVDPATLRMAWRPLAARLADDRRDDVPGTWPALLADCVCASGLADRSASAGARPGHP